MQGFCYAGYRLPHEANQLIDRYEHVTAGLRHPYGPLLLLAPQRTFDSGQLNQPADPAGRTMAATWFPRFLHPTGMRR